MIQRSAFVLHVKPDKIDEYVEAHASVWPEMLADAARPGIRNYAIFRDGNRVFGYFESDDRDRAAAHTAAQEINTRWRDTMAALLEERVADEGPAALEKSSVSPTRP